MNEQQDNIYNDSVAISEDDSLYYEKESARLLQEQMRCSINLFDAFMQAFSHVFKTIQDEQELLMWKVLVGKKNADKYFKRDVEIEKIDRLITEYKQVYDGSLLNHVES